MNTTSVRIKFRESTVDGKEGTLYYQVIHNRTVRQIGTDYHLYSLEWQEEGENFVLSKGTNTERNACLQELAERIRNDRLRFARIICELDNNGIGYTADDVVAKYNELTSRQSFQIYMQGIIKQQKTEGRTRISETYTAAMRSFMAFRENKDSSWDSITQAIVKSYEVWLKSKGVSLNTVSFYMRILSPYKEEYALPTNRNAKKDELEQAVKENGNRENIITKKPTETELSQKDKKRIAIVVNSIPIGYIICIVFGIGSMWMQMSVCLLALCLSCLIGMVMPVRTFYNIGKKSFLISVAYIIVRIFMAVLLGICGH